MVQHFGYFESLNQIHWIYVKTIQMNDSIFSCTKSCKTSVMYFHCLQDVCRMWLAVAYAKEEAGELSEASLEILPDVIKQIDSTKPPAREQIESKLNQRNSRGMAKNFDKFQSRPPSPKPRSQKVGDRKRAKPWENAPWNQ